MKKFLEFITEARNSQAAQQAKKLGLRSDGSGYWVDRAGKKQAKTLKGKLEFLKQRKSSGEDGEQSQQYKPKQVKPKKLAQAIPGKKRLGATVKQAPKERKAAVLSTGANRPKTPVRPQKQDARGITVSISFGKFNPPTKAHQNLFNSLKQVSSGQNFYIFPSRSQDGKQNPLSPDVKIDYMKEMFPEYADRIIDSDEFNTIFDVLTYLNTEGYTVANIVCTPERVAEIDSLAKKQNGQLYQYTSINVISSGPKSLDDAGSTSDQARKAVLQGDFESFKKTMPPSFKLSQELFDDLISSIKEGAELWQVSPTLCEKELRENYIFGNIFKVGSLVENSHTGLRGEVMRSGANHLICLSQEGIMFKSWIKDVFEVELQ